MCRLEGKVAIITGGASGIGECTARLFCRHGAKVVIADIQDRLGKSVCSELSPVASFIHCDVTNEDDVSNAVDHAVTKFGKLDIMFNNAGISGLATGNDILNCSKTDFERVLAVNVVGPFLGTKHAARVMVPARGGVIIATASIAGMVSSVASHAYASSKSAVAAFTRSVAAELGRYGVRANCVSPAAVATPLTQRFLGLEGEALEAATEATANLKGVRLRVDDVASAVLYLASDDARFVSGHNLVVDGGFSIARRPLI